MCVEVCIQGSCGKQSCIQSFNNNQDLQPWLLDLAYQCRFLFRIDKVNKVDFELFVVTVLGGLFFCTESCEKKFSLLRVYCEDDQILEQIVCGISFCGDIQCLIGLCPAQPALADAA